MAKKTKAPVSQETRINEEQFFEALMMLAKENEYATTSEEIVERVQSAIEKAIKKSYPNCEKIMVHIDTEEKKINASVMKLVVDDDPLDDGEINIAQARLLNPTVLENEMISVPLNISEFGRAAALAAKQSVKEDVKKIHRESLLKKFEDKENQCLTVKVTRIEPDSRNVTVEYDKTELYLFPNEQIPNERLRNGQLVKVYVTSISNKTKRPIIKISRAHKDLLKCLFEMNIPEIADGTVEVKAVSREPGFRSKVAVISNDTNVNAVSSCIGKNHKRIQPIIDELGGEKIDVIPYSEKIEEFIATALAPAVISDVIITDYEEKSCVVTVDKEQLSLAIGNRGQNAKLAAKLTGFKIDIKSDDQIEEIGAANRLAEENRKIYEAKLAALEDDSFEIAEDGEVINLDEGTEGADVVDISETVDVNAENSTANDEIIDLDDPEPTEVTTETNADQNAE